MLPNRKKLLGSKMLNPPQGQDKKRERENEDDDDDDHKLST